MALHPTLSGSRLGGLLAMAACLSLSGVVRAEFNKGPAVQNLSDSSAVVFVHSDRPEVTLEWGSSPSYGQTVTLESTSGSQGGHRVLGKDIDVVVATFVVGEKPGWIYEFELTGLPPDTTVHYQVTNAPDGMLPAEVTADLSFTTAPLPGSPFVFVAGGDGKAYPQGLLGNNLHNQAISDLMAQDLEARLFIETGDLVDDSNPDANWATLFNIRRALFSRVAWFPSIGNHDYDSPDHGFNFQAYVAVPRTPLSPGHGLPPNDEGDTVDTELFYSFDFGGVHFIAFDGNNDMAVGSAQHEFIAADLAAHRCLGPLVVFGHVPWYSSAAEGGVNPAMAEIYHPLFAQEGVDLVFFGHRHFYERMNPSMMDGVQYVVSGGAGATFDEISSPPQSYSAFAEVAHHYVRMAVEGWDLTGTAIAENGSVLDTFTLTDVYLNDPEPCQFEPGEPDAGPPDDGGLGGDGGAGGVSGTGGQPAGGAGTGVPSGGSGAVGAVAEDGGCGCTWRKSSTGAAGFVVLLGWMLARRRAPRRPGNSRRAA